MEQAKKNVENYLVVGILEEYDDFIKVLEKLLPNFFHGAYKQSKTPGIMKYHCIIINEWIGLLFRYFLRFSANNNELFLTVSILDPSVVPKSVLSLTRKKQKPSERVLAIAKEYMKLEYEFYDFIKERFHKLKKSLDIH